MIFDLQGGYSQKNMYFHFLGPRNDQSNSKRLVSIRDIHNIQKKLVQYIARCGQGYPVSTEYSNTSMCTCPQVEHPEQQRHEIQQAHHNVNH